MKKEIDLDPVSQQSSDPTGSRSSSLTKGLFDGLTIGFAPFYPNIQYTIQSSSLDHNRTHVWLSKAVKRMGLRTHHKTCQHHNFNIDFAMDLL